MKTNAILNKFKNNNEKQWKSTKMNNVDWCRYIGASTSPLPGTTLQMLTRHDDYRRIDKDDVMWCDDGDWYGMKVQPCRWLRPRCWSMCWREEKNWQRRCDVMSWWNLLWGESPPSPRRMPQMLNDVMARSNSLATALDDDKEQTQKYSNKTFGTTSTVERSLTLATPTRNMRRNARTASVS